jgi:hypothetical protein
MRLISAKPDLTRETIEKGFSKPELNPMALAEFIQTCSFGKVLGDSDPYQIIFDVWKNFIPMMLHESLGAKNKSELRL